MTRNIVLAGWAQMTQPKNLDTPPLDIMALMAEVSGQACKMAGISSDRDMPQGIMVVLPGSRTVPAPADQLAHRLCASPSLKIVSKVGGNSPQTLINRAAGMIARNEIDSVLIAGAECYIRREDPPQAVDSALFRGIPHDYDGDDFVGSTPLENRHGIEHPMQGFPLFETALWAASGKDLNTYLKGVGQMWAGFSRVAAGHPNAWSRAVRTWEEIVTPGPANRPIAFPYPKFMNAFVSVDQGAAVLLMAETGAEKLKPDTRHRVYFAGGGYAEDRQRFLIEKSDFTTSAPLKEAVNKALDRSGMTLDTIDSLDLYACFPCAVSIARKMLNLSENDHRALTLTGGLGFFGGPGNNYNLHAVVTLADQIASGRVASGLVTALGWFMHKHAAGVYCSRPIRPVDGCHDLEDQRAPLVGDPPLPVEEQVSGRGIIETYTIVYAKDQTPEYAVIYGRTPRHTRFIAQTRRQAGIFRQLATECCVGRTVTLNWDNSKQINIADIQ